jgi:hypothetical protein
MDPPGRRGGLTTGSLPTDIPPDGLVNQIVSITRWVARIKETLEAAYKNGVAMQG